MKVYQVIWRLITYKPWLFFLNLLVWILVALAELGPGYLVKIFFDLLTDSTTFQLQLEQVAMLLVLLTIVHGGLIILGILIDIPYRFNISYLVRSNLLKIVLRLPAGQKLAQSNGEIISYFRDDVQEIENVADLLIDATTELLYVVVALVIMWLIDPILTIFAVLPLIFVLITTQIVGRRVQAYRGRNRIATTTVTGFLGESLSAVQAIQLTNASESILHQFDKVNDARQSAAVTDVVYTKILKTLFASSASITTGIIMLLAADALRDTSFTVGDFSLFVSYLGLLSRFTSVFGNFLTTYKQTDVSTRRLMTLFPHAEPEKLFQHDKLSLKGPWPNVRSLSDVRVEAFKQLSAQKFNYTYANSDSAWSLENVSFDLFAGQLVAVTGQIGAGKTTLLQAAIGVLKTQAGAIYWNGQRVDEPDAFLTPPRVAYVPQSPKLLDRSIRDNILLGQPESSVDLDLVLYQAAFEEDLKALPHGLETVVGRSGYKLSGGQMQRIAMARALAQNASVMVLDDLSSSLDIQTEEQIWNRILFQPERKTSFLIASYRKDILNYADQIIFLDNGRVIAQGTSDELLMRTVAFREFWEQL